MSRGAMAHAKRPAAAGGKAAAAMPARSRSAGAHTGLLDGALPGEADRRAAGGGGSDSGFRFGTLPLHAPGAPAPQAKLKVSRPGDKYEQEADRVADTVLRMPDPSRKPDGPAKGGRTGLQRAEEPEVTALHGGQEREEGEAQVSRKSRGGAPRTVPPRLHGRIAALKGAGKALPDSSREFFEPRFGHDFSKVRVHTDHRAAETAGEVGARAFTVGRDVVFGAGQYQPGSSEGKRLLAHELTHTIQQGASVKRIQADRPGHAPGNGSKSDTVPGASRSLQRNWLIAQKAAHAVHVQSPGERVAARGVEVKARSGPQLQGGLLGSIVSFFASIGDWIKEKARFIAVFFEKATDYRLLQYILRKDPISGNAIETNDDELLLSLLKHGGRSRLWYLALMAFGKETAKAWIKKQVNKSGISSDRVSSIVKKAIDTEKSDEENRKAIAVALKPIYGRIRTISSGLSKKVTGFVFKAALKSFGGEKILAGFRKAGNVINRIANDPSAFLANLAGALKKGFNQFRTNILKHLMTGLATWLFGNLGKADLTMPDKLDLKGIFSIITQVLGLTYKNVKTRALKYISPKIIARLEEGSEFVRTLASKGIMGVWEQVKQYAVSLKERAITAIRNWIIKQIVKGAVTQLVLMFNPVGAIIKAIKTVYDIVMVFIERAKQIAEFINALFNAIAPISLGKIDAAANWIEAALGKTIPVILGFLARFVSLGNVADGIRGVIKKLRAPVNKIIDRIARFVARKGKAMLAKGKAAVKTGVAKGKAVVKAGVAKGKTAVKAGVAKGKAVVKAGAAKGKAVVKAGAAKGKAAVGAIINWWKIRKSFTAGGESHSLSFKGKGSSAQLILATTPKTLDTYIKSLKPPDVSQDAINAIKIQAAKIDALKKEPTGKDISMTRTQGKTISAEMNKLAKLLAAAQPGKKAPPTKITYTPTTANGDVNAEKVEAKPLSIDPGGNFGSIPTQSSKLWKAVNRRKGKYVRGHLLNHHLYGVGAKKNLTPITRALNAKMETDVESQAKNLVLGEGEVISFEATANYSPTSDRTHIKKENLLAKSISFVVKKMEFNSSKTNAKRENPSDWKEGKVVSNIPKKLNHDLPPDEPVSSETT